MPPFFIVASYDRRQIGRKHYFVSILCVCDVAQVEKLKYLREIILFFRQGHREGNCQTSWPEEEELQGSRRGHFLGRGFRRRDRGDPRRQGGKRLRLGGRGGGGGGQQDLR